MKPNEAADIVDKIESAYPPIRLNVESKEQYGAMLARLPFKQTRDAVVLVCRSEQRLPSVGRLSHLLKQSDQLSDGDGGDTFTGRKHLVVSDICVGCQQRITDREFDEHAWEFVPDGDGPVTGRIHRRCKAAHYEMFPDQEPKPTREQIAQARRALAFRLGAIPEVTP